VTSLGGLWHSCVVVGQPPLPPPTMRAEEGDVGVDPVAAAAPLYSSESARAARLGRLDSAGAARAVATGQLQLDLHESAEEEMGSEDAAEAAAVPAASAAAKAGVAGNKPPKAGGNGACAAAVGPGMATGAGTSTAGAAAMGGKLCTHVLVIGFDHSEGNVLEFAHPPLGPPCVGEDGTERLALPPAWRHVPFQALPDGVHQHEVGTSPPPFFFSVPALCGERRPMHAVASHRQLSAAVVHARRLRNVAVATASSGGVGAEGSEDGQGGGVVVPASPRAEGRITRNAVQKSLVVVCAAPLYGLLAPRVTAAADAFARGGFALSGHEELRQVRRPSRPFWRPF
jgi:hypothetical protein